MSKEAMKLALDALKSISEMVDYEGNGFKLEYEIKALEEALKQEQDVPEVCFGNIKQEQGEPVAEKVYDPEDDTTYIQYFMPHDLIPTGTKFYTTPQQRPSRSDIKPLTDEQIGMAFRKAFPIGGVIFTNGATEFARAIEADHGIKE